VKLGRALAAAALLAGLLGPGEARADERPYDAPVAAAGAERAAAPEVTPEYASLEERGVRLVFHLLMGRDRAQGLLARALAIRAALSADLGRDVLGTMEIRVAAMPTQMPALAPSDLPAGAPAVAFRDLHLVVMSLGSPLPLEAGELEERLRHALAHLALDEAVGDHDLPRWFHESFALHESGEDAASRAEALCLAALRDRLLGLRDMAARFPDGPPAGSVAAAQGADFVRFLSEPSRRQRWTSLVERLREGKGFEAALDLAYDGDLDRVEHRFRKEMARRYSFVPVLGLATALWVVVALGVVLRRRRLAARRAEGLGERRAAAASRAAARLLAREPPSRRLPAEDEELAQAMPPDPDVPKLEHDGRWYTLH
jgi:hypothetical protein